MFDVAIYAVLIFGFPVGVLVGYMWRARISRQRASDIEPSETGTTPDEIETVKSRRVSGARCGRSGEISTAASRCFGIGDRADFRYRPGSARD
jgi:hypothetical protein